MTLTKNPATEKIYLVPVSELSEDVPVLNATVEELARSIAAVGQLNPVIVDQQGRIIDGFHRIAALRKLGHSDAKAIVADLDE